MTVNLNVWGSGLWPAKSHTFPAMTNEDIEFTLDIAAKANASIAATYSPWYAAFSGKDPTVRPPLVVHLPAYYNSTSHARVRARPSQLPVAMPWSTVLVLFSQVRGDTEANELKLFGSQLTNLAVLAGRYQVPVAVVFFDSEKLAYNNTSTAPWKSAPAAEPRNTIWVCMVEPFLNRKKEQTPHRNGRGVCEFSTAEHSNASVCALAQ